MIPSLEENILLTESTFKKDIKKYKERIVGEKRMFNNMEKISLTSTSDSTPLKWFIRLTNLIIAIINWIYVLIAIKNIFILISYNLLFNDTADGSGLCTYFEYLYNIFGIGQRDVQ